MALFFYDRFVADLRNHADSGFARRALTKFFDRDGAFRADADDHRYHGIDDAWIRYISTGASGWRAIYLRRGGDVHLYRAGEHSIEDNLVKPKSSLVLYPAMEINEEEVDPGSAVATAHVRTKPRLLSSLGESELRSALLSRRMCPHKEILLISPTVEPRCLAPTSRLGSVLYDLHEEGASITILTRPPETRELLKEFFEIEAKGITFLFNEEINANLFVFRLKDGSDYQANVSGLSDAAFIGSASLTMKSIEETPMVSDNLLYELLEHDLVHAEEYSMALAARSVDSISVRNSLAKDN